MSKFSIRKIAAAAAFAVAALSPVASHAAAQLNNYLVGGVNLLEDTDFDRVLRCPTGAVCTDISQMVSVTSGDFRVGDVFEAALRFENASGTQLGNIDNYQLTAYNAMAVASIQLVPVEVFPGIFAPVTTLFFVPTAQIGIDSGLGALGMVRLYESNVENFDVTLSPDTLIANIQGGTEVVTLGLGVGEDDYWYSTVDAATGLPVGNIDLLKTRLQFSSSILGVGQLGLSVLTNPGGINIVPEQMDGALGGKHDVVGQVAGYALGPTANTDWLIETDTKVRFVRIPEPAGLALVGLAVAMAGFVGVRRKS